MAPWPLFGGGVHTVHNCPWYQIQHACLCYRDSFSDGSRQRNIRQWQAQCIWEEKIETHEWTFMRHRSPAPSGFVPRAGQFPWFSLLVFRMQTLWSCYKRDFCGWLGSWRALRLYLLRGWDPVNSWNVSSLQWDISATSVSRCPS